MINANIAADVRSEGYRALAKALGAVGMIRFIQQSDKGYGDYTKEKYDVDEPDWNTLNSEFDAFKKAGGDARHLAIIK